jgi:hypothetical protein
MIKQSPSSSIFGSPLQSGNSDPFGSTPVALSVGNHGLINTWRLLFIHLVWPKKPHIEYSPVLSAWHSMMGIALSNEACMHALLACATFWKAANADSPKQQKALVLKGMGHEGAGLTALRTELEDPECRLVHICTVYLLASAALKANHPEKATVHLKALKSLVDRIGGLMSLPFSIRGAINHVDIAASAGSHRPLVFSQHLWEPGNIMLELSPSEKNLIHHSRFSTTRLSEDVPLEMLEVFALYRDLMAIHDMAPLLENRQRRTSLLCSAQVTAFAKIGTTRDVKAELATYPDLSGPAAARLALEVCMRTALTYMADMLVYSRHDHATVLVDFYDIQSYLDNADVRGQAPESLLLWLLATGAAIEYNFHKRGGTRWWHAPRFLLLARHMGLKSVDAVAPVLGLFLYDENPIARYLEAVFALGDFILAVTMCDADEVDQVGKSPKCHQQSSEYIWSIPQSKAWDSSSELQGNVVQWTAPSSDYLDMLI